MSTWLGSEYISLLNRIDAALLRRHERACPWPTTSGAVTTRREGAKMARDERAGVVSETGVHMATGRYGTPTERLYGRLTRRPNGCLEWTGHTNGGYGQLRVDSKVMYAHRFAWELANGPIPNGLKVLHHCDNPPCCETNPTPGYPDGHLFLGTNADNSADMAAKGRARNIDATKTHCPQGHPYDEANTYINPKTGGRACRTCSKARDASRSRAGWRQKRALRRAS